MERHPQLESGLLVHEITKLEIAIELLDGIKFFERQAEFHMEYASSDVALHITEYRKRCFDKADHYKRCAERLRQRYSRLIGTLGLVLVLFFGACAPALHPADMRFNKQIINQHSAVKPLKVKHCER